MTKIVAKNFTVHPINPRISKIRVSPELSQETPAFTAQLDVCGLTFVISNEGRGGENRYYPQIDSNLMRGLDNLCAHNLPPVTECGGFKLPKPFLMRFETWTFDCVYNATSKKWSKALLSC